MRIAITGSTGLVGTAVCEALQAEGHQLVRLVRQESSAPDTVCWDPRTGALDLAKLGTIDAVIHLAGENVAGGRWTNARRQRIQESRGPATERLCCTLAGMPQPPKVFISASATGIYGNRGDEELDEQSSAGPADDFLAEVARAWEGGTQPLQDFGTRVVHLRIGIVLAKHGGALAKMLPPFRMGLGGRLGNGMHWMSWISLHDLVRVVQHALRDDDLQGPVLAVSPNPVTNHRFTKALGKALRRPTIFPVPRFMLRLIFGDFADVLLSSQRANPRRLLNSGFEFEHAHLEAALKATLRSDGANV